MAKTKKKFHELSESESQQHFIDKSGILGKTIKAVRYMTEAEANNMGWSGKSVVIELSDGTTLIPSMDDEGNNGGALFVQKPNGDDEGFPVF